MINPMKLVRMARKWQNLAVRRHKRITPPAGADGGAIVDKGCFAVYTCDGIRFMIPLDYLKNDIFQELLEFAEEEYGSQSNGPIRLPLKASYMQYITSQLERQMNKDVEEELRITITSWRCLSTSNLQHKHVHTQLLVC